MTTQNSPRLLSRVVRRARERAAINSDMRVFDDAVRNASPSMRAELYAAAARQNIIR